MHCPNVAIKTDQSEEEDTAVYVDVEGDLLELAEDLYVFKVRPLEGEVEGEREGENPGWVTQCQVQQENIAGARCFPEATVVDYSCDISQDPHGKGKSEENQQNIAIPLAIDKLAAEYCWLVQKLQQHLWDLKNKN